MKLFITVLLCVVVGEAVGLGWHINRDTKYSVLEVPMDSMPVPTERTEFVKLLLCSGKISYPEAFDQPCGTLNPIFLILAGQTLNTTNHPRIYKQELASKRPINHSTIKFTLHCRGFFNFCPRLSHLNQLLHTSVDENMSAF